jgi:predicted translin family RNA/ssDNA-binding protein
MNESEREEVLRLNALIARLSASVIDLYGAVGILANKSGDSDAINFVERTKESLTDLAEYMRNMTSQS